MSEIRDDLRYTKEHEWARMDGKTMQIGITAFAVSQLGDVTMVELPEVGDTITKGDTFGTVESVKSVSELYAPASGTITKVNEALEDAPEMVNDGPYEGGWLVELEISNEAELEELLSPEAYKELTDE